MMDYAIGMLWALGTVGTDGKGTPRIIVRHRDKQMLDDVVEYGQLEQAPFLEQTKAKTYWRLNIPYRTKLIQRLFAAGWQPKSDKARGMAAGDVDPVMWLKGYCRMRAHFTFAKRNAATVRILIIYGSAPIIDDVNLLLSQLYNTKLKKPQHIKKNIVDTWQGECWAIYYQGQKEVELLAKRLEMK